VVVLLPSEAGGAALANGSVTLTAGGPGETNTVVSPLVSEVPINVVVGPNSKLARPAVEAAGYPSGAVPVKFLECADPGGTTANLPTKSTQCEPETVISSANLRADGSIVMRNYLILALPDPALGSSSGTTCDMQHACVIGIFTNYNDFTKPHLFSSAFDVAPATSSSNGSAGTSGASGSGSRSSSGSSGSGGSGASNGGSTVLPGQSAQPGSTPNSTIPAGATSSSGGLSLTGVSPLFFGLLISGFLLLLFGTLLFWIRRRNA
jgi:hypothetical protein